jgi:UrcA family protein
MAITAKLLTVAALSVMSLAGAYAAVPVASHSSIVRYDDLNLDRARDVAKLYNRVTLAADRVCGPRSLTGSYYKSAIYQTCYTETVAEAIARIDRPSVTSYYLARGGEPASLNTTIARQ